MLHAPRKTVHSFCFSRTSVRFSSTDDARPLPQPHAEGPPRARPRRRGGGASVRGPRLPRGEPARRRSRREGAARVDRLPLREEGDALRRGPVRDRRRAHDGARRRAGDAAPGFARGEGLRGDRRVGRAHRRRLARYRSLVGEAPGARAPAPPRAPRQPGARRARVAASARAGPRAPVRGRRRGRAGRRALAGDAGDGGAPPRRRDQLLRRGAADRRPHRRRRRGAPHGRDVRARRRDLRASRARLRRAAQRQDHGGASCNTTRRRGS